MNTLDPIKELYDLDLDKEETLWITEIVDNGLGWDSEYVDL